MPVSEESSFAFRIDARPEPQPGADERDVAGAPGSDPDMVLRYCGIIKEFYYAGPTDEFCCCGHKIGAV
jgi:hypothetical protein